MGILKFLSFSTILAIYFQYINAKSFDSARRPPTIVVQPVNNMNATPSGKNLFVPNKLYNGSFGYFQSPNAFSTLSLSCVVNSYPISNVYWQFNDNTLPAGVPVSYQSSNNSVTLVFTPTAESPIRPGKYQCVAELPVSADAQNPTWKVMSDSVVLIPIEKYSTDQAYNQLPVNQYQTLSLRPVNPMPEYLGKIDIVGWALQKPGQLNPDVFDPSTWGSWITLDDQNGLNWAYVDQNVLNNYIFFPTYFYTNPDSSLMYTAFTGYQLIVNPGTLSSSPFTAASISGSSSQAPDPSQTYSVTVQHGKRAVLYCYFTGLFSQASTLWPVSVTWQYLSGDRNTQSPTGSNIKTKISSSLIFEPVHSTDEQTYGCTATSNCLGSADCPKTLGPYKIKMLVNSAPIWVTPPNSSVEMGATESLVLNFTVRARPAATFAFSFVKTDGSTVKIDSSGAAGPRFNVTAPVNWQDVYFSQNVTIASTTPYSESGVLIVDVQNSLGSVRAYVSVLVFKKTRITSAPVAVEHGRLQYSGGDLQWNVAADGEPIFPTPTAQWYLRRPGQSETQLQNTPGQFEISPNGLSFKLVQPKDASTIYGDYRVVVSNGHDDDQRTFTLEAQPATAAIIIWLVVALVIVAVLILLVLLALLLVRLFRKTSDTYEVGAEEEAVGRNRDEEFKQEQSHEYIRPTSAEHEPMELDPLDPNTQKAHMASASRLED